MRTAPPAWLLAPSSPLALSALVVPVLVLYAPLGATPAFIILALLTFMLYWRQHGALPGWPLTRGQTALLSFAIFWAAVSIAGWGLDLWRPIRTWAGVAALALASPPLVTAFRQLPPTDRDRIRMALAIGVSLGMATAFLSTYLPLLDPGYVTNVDPLRRFISRGVIVNVLFLGPALAALVHLGRRRWALALAALAVSTVFGAHPLAGKLALTALGVGAVAAWVAPRLTRIATSWLIVLGLASFPLLAHLPDPQGTVELWPQLPNSAHHRLTIWKFTAERVLEHPVRGWGLDASRDIPGAEEHVHVWLPFNQPQASGETRYLVLEQLLPLHPHSAPGQIWLELGMVGAAAIGGLLLLTLGRLRRFGSKLDGTIALAVLTAAFLVAGVSFGLWQSWWQASLWLTTLFMAAVADPSRQ
ncbi:MAG: O-antigen ligase family protein [Magnetospirillum sp.]|nr:O-antigen ligase family protein [Magnetospirillum sp.]